MTTALRRPNRDGEIAPLERFLVLRYSSRMHFEQPNATTILSPVFPVGSSFLLALISLLLLRSQRQ